MKYYNVFSRREYTSQGEDKTRWMKVGEIKITSSGGKYLKLYHLPGTDYTILPELQDETEDTLVIE